MDRVTVAETCILAGGMALLTANAAVRSGINPRMAPFVVAGVVAVLDRSAARLVFGQWGAPTHWLGRKRGG